MNNIYFDEEVEISENLKNSIEKAVEDVCRIENLPDIDISVLICSKETIAELNGEKRNVFAPTDVLSFPNLEFDENFNVITDIEKEKDPETGGVYLGDIAICPDIIFEHAEEYGNTPEEEMRYMAIHSMYHLLGYDHITDEDKKVMREREKRVIK